MKLLKEKGYYNITTADIAKEAGVSTGILYRYFKNKMSIVVEIMNQLVEHRINPMLEGMVVNIIDKDNFVLFLERTMHELRLLHEELGALHNDLGNLLNQEGQISSYVNRMETEIVKRVGALLVSNDFQMDHMTEKIHIAYDLLEDYSHEVVFKQHQELDYEVMKGEIIRLISYLVFG